MIISWEEVKEIPPPQLKIFPVVAIPHKSQKFRAIIGLLFKLLTNGFDMSPVNEVVRYTAKQEAIEQLGKVPPRIIAEISEAPEGNGPILFIKIDIKYG